MVIKIQSNDSAFETDKIVSICLHIQYGKEYNAPVKSNINYTFMCCL